MNTQKHACFGAVFGAILLSACNMAAPMQIGKPSLSPTQDEIVSIDAHAELSPIAFEKAIVALKRGTVIAHFPGPTQANFDVSLCNNLYGSNTELEWSSGSRLLGGWDDEVAELFIDVFQAKGYAVVGDPTKLFGSQEDMMAAKYRVAAKVVNIKGNICEEHHWWDGRPMGKYAAEFSHDVEWSVYSSLEKRVVATFESEGFGRQEKATQEGVMNAFNDAFASAAEGLATNKHFYGIISDISAPEENTASPSLENMTITGAPLSKRSFSDWAGDGVQGTVTVRVGRGHGSGFIISDDGYILTNRHVVGSADEVAIIFDTGLEVVGSVIRSHRRRDVALVKVPARGLKAYGIRQNRPVQSLEEVYAIGSPLKEDLNSTVTKGIVSALRTDKQDNLDYIQSDADISGGNSGGPLLDANGNVVGIAVSGYGVQQLSAGLNLFIPINDALEYLNIEIAQK